MSIFSAALLLFLVIDPLGNTPAFLALLRGFTPARQRAILARELAIALGVLVLFLFAGQYILEALQISEPSLTIAGGLVLFLIAVKMIFPGPSSTFGEHPGGEPFIFPLAIPLIAGPSSMATVMLIMSREPQRWPEWLVALVCAWGAAGAILFFSANISKMVGQKGLLAMEKLMGMVLIAIATQLTLSGIAIFARSL